MQRCLDIDMIQVHGRPTPVLSSPTPRKLLKANGACSVCGLIRKIHSKNGKVHLHGSRRKRCLGSNQLPVADSSKHGLSSSQGGLSEAGSQRTTSVDLTTSVLVESVQKRIIFHPEPKSRILKHIPKAARSCTGRLTINKILASTLHHWQVLLSFAAIVLEQPMREGRRHNLTSTIKKRAEDFFHTWPDKGALLFDQHLQDCRLSGNGKNMDDNARATAISSKLEEGNINAAVRILCSDDKPAPINARRWRN